MHLMWSPNVLVAACRHVATVNLLSLWLSFNIQHMNETKTKKENKNSKTSCYCSHFTTNFSEKTFITLKNISYRYSCKVISIQDSLKMTLKRLFESLCTVEVFETKEAIFGTEIGWLCCKKSFQQVSKEIITIGGLFPSRSLEMWFPFFFRTYYNLTLLALSMPHGARFFWPPLSCCCRAEAKFEIIRSTLKK